MMAGIVVAVLVLGFVLLVVRVGRADVRWEREQERRFQEKQFIKLVADWLLAYHQQVYRQQTDDLLSDMAPKSTPLAGTTSKAIAHVITTEGLGEAFGFNKSEISRFKALHGESVKVTKTALREWANEGANVYRIAELVLDRPARAAFQTAASGIARIHQEEFKLLQSFHQKSWDAVHQSEMSARQDARRSYEEEDPGKVRWRAEKKMEKAIEAAARPYKETLDFSSRILERVELLLRREHAVSLAEALWKAITLGSGKPES